MRGAALAGDHLRQRALAVPVDARNAEDLALLEARARRPRRRARRPRPARSRSRSSSTVSPATSIVVVGLGLHELLAQLGDVGDRARLLAEHDPDDLRPQLVRGFSRSARRSIVPASRPWRRIEMKSPSESASCSLCVMKITAWPCSFSRRQHLRQLGDALRRQHRGRLVEDQHARPAPQRLDDLDLLLVAEREVDRLRVRIDLDTEQLGELREARFALPPRRASACGCRRASGSRARSAPGSARSAGARCRCRGRALCAATRSPSRPPRSGSCPRPGGAARRGCRSGSTCRRRSRPAGSAPRPGGGSGRPGRSRAPPGTPS